MVLLTAALVVWLGLLTTIVAICRAAAYGDAAEAERSHRTARVSPAGASGARGRRMHIG